MVSYSELIRFNEPLVPPTDELSEAMYTNTKLEYSLKNLKQNDQGNQEINDVFEDRQLINPIQYNSQQQQETSQQQPEIRPKSNWKLLRVIAGAHGGWVRSVAVDNVTNKWFVTGSSDATIKVWDLASSSLKAVITGHIMAVRALAVSKRHPYLYSGSEDKEVKCFDLERTNSSSGCEIRDYHGHLGGIYTLSLHPELDLLFTGGRDASVRVWDVRSRAEVMTLTGHKGDVTSIITNSLDPQAITSSTDGTIRLWDIRNQKTELVITHHSKSIRSMVEHPSESTFCSSDTSGNFKQWLFPQGDLLNEFKGDSGIVNTVSINQENTIFAGYDNGDFEVFDYVSGQKIQAGKTTPCPGSTESAIYCSAFDMSGLRLITGESDHSIKIWGEDE